MLGYLLSLVYSMVTNRAAFASDQQQHEAPGWNMGRTVTVLVLTATAIGVLSELLGCRNRGDDEDTGPVAFLRRIDPARSSATRRNTTPPPVFLGRVFDQPMTLAFRPFEVVSVALAVWNATQMMNDSTLKTQLFHGSLRRARNRTGSRERRC
jgi:Ca2+/H+ antiporter